MELLGKTIKIHLTTPLIAVDAHHNIQSIQGKVLDKASGGFLIEVLAILPPKEGYTYPYKTIFVPSHKIDFFGVVA